MLRMILIGGDRSRDLNTDLLLVRVSIRTQGQSCPQASQEELFHQGLHRTQIVTQGNKQVFLISFQTCLDVEFLPCRLEFRVVLRAEFDAWALASGTKDVHYDQVNIMRGCRMTIMTLL